MRMYMMDRPIATITLHWHGRSQ